MKICPKCGKEAGDTYSFCPACGCELPIFSTVNINLQKQVDSYKDKTKKLKSIIIIMVVAIFIIIAGVAAGAYYIYSENKNVDEAYRLATEEFVNSTPAELSDELIAKVEELNKKTNLFYIGGELKENIKSLHSEISNMAETKALIDKYNGDYVDVTGRSVGQVAEESGVTYDEFLSEYKLPLDMPPEVSENAAYNMIPFGVIIEMNQLAGMEAVESAKEALKLPDWITYDTPWGEAIGQATLGAYVGEDHLEQFKAYYNLDDSVNGNTLYRDVKYQIDLQDRNKRIESENSQ